MTETPQEAPQTQPEESPSLANDFENDISQNAGARTAEIAHNPALSLEETRNASAGKAPTGAGGTAPSTVEEWVPSKDEPHATNLPTGSGTAIDPQTANPEVNPNAAQEKKSGTKG